LVDLYHKNFGLKKCATKVPTHHADSATSKSQLPLYYSFFSELVEIQTHLEDYSMYERHYNQLIASNYFHRHLLSLNSQVE
ncbi:20315_t:CDS:1, partial [Gigaspora margarita]